MKLRTSILSVVLMLVVALPSLAQESIWEGWDGRINVISHFGGDVLYCTADRGCWALNMDGDLLWEVPQSDIEAAKTAACDTGLSQTIEAGQGTYGPMTLDISCYTDDEPTLELTGYDEWGKVNSLSFGASYLPIGPAVEATRDRDGDGVPDDEDLCPDVGDLGMGLHSSGCPIVYA